MSNPSASPPAGWYPDPGGSGRRWWDGTQWTSHHEPGERAGHSVTLNSPVGELDPALICAAAGAVLLFLSLFLPWASGRNSTGFTSFNRHLPWLMTGGDLDTVSAGALPHGFLFLLVVVATGVACYMMFTGEDWLGQALLGIGGFTVLLALIDALRFAQALDDRFPEAGPAWGIWVGVFAGLLIAAGGGLTLIRYGR